MIAETVKKLEDAIRRIDSMEGGRKTELLALLNSLKDEVQRLSETHEEQAHSIASLADMATHEATRQEKSAELLNHSLDGLSISGQGFKATHPQLVKTINDICTMLANIGI